MSAKEKILNSAFYDSYREEWLRLLPDYKIGYLQAAVKDHLESLVYLYDFADFNNIKTLRDDTMQAVRICVGISGRLPSNQITKWVFSTISGSDSKESHLCRFLTNLYYENELSQPCDEIVHQQASKIDPAFGTAILSLISNHLRTTELRAERQAKEIVHLKKELEAGSKKGALNAGEKHAREEDSSSEETGREAKIVKIEEVDMT